MKKSGSSVFLMELVVVILFFSLSTVVTLRLFITAYAQERGSTRLNSAMEQAQNTAELFRAQGRVLFQSDGWAEDRQGALVIYTREQEAFILRVELETSSNDAGTLLSGELRVLASESPSADPVYTLSLSRYEPTPEVAP